MTYRVGILGAGDMGRIHGATLLTDPRVKIVAVADPDKERARLLAAPSQAKPAATLDDLLAEKIDMLFVASPNFTHCQVVCTALERNIHVFSEKPMGLNLDEGRKVLETARKSKALYQLGFNRRFSPLYLAIHDRVTKGFKPYVIDIKMNEGDMTNRPWITDRKLTGGYLNENTLHFFDMVQWLAGPIREIFAVGKANIYQDMTDFVLVVATENGTLANISTSGHASWFYPWERMEVIGDHEALINDEAENLIYSPGIRKPIEVTNYFQIPKDKKWGYEDEVKAFLNAVEKGLPSPYGAEMGFEILQLIAAAYQSVETGRKISVPPRVKDGVIRE